MVAGDAVSVPTAWLADPLGAGSPNVQAVLPAPADGFYTEPAGEAPSFDALPAPVPAVGIVNGGGSVAARTNGLSEATVRVRRTTVYGAVLLDAVTMPTLGAPRPDPRPPGAGVTPPVRPATPPPAACAARPLTTASACGVRPAPSTVTPESRP